MGAPLKPVALIVAADEPALFFSSVEAAEDYLEAVDVRNGVYPAAYGPGGERFEVETVGEDVKVRPCAAVKAPDALAALLQAYFAAIGDPPINDLAEMLRRAEQHLTC